MQRDQIQSGPKSMRSPLRSGYHRVRTPLGLCQAVMDCIATAAKTTDRRREVESRLAVEQDKARALAGETAEMQALSSLMMGHFGVGS